MRVTFVYKRDSWKNFEGFPQQSAAKCYVHLANELQRELSSGGKVSGIDSESGEQGPQGLSKGVSSFQNTVG
jgi:hypothetical protein